MKRVYIAAILGLAALLTGEAPKASAEPTQCHVAQARYSIYVENDLLWVIGSKHLLMVVIDGLDKELDARGWESTVVYGDFTLCARPTTDARQLTNRDRVRVTGYSNLRYARR